MVVKSSNLNEVHYDPATKALSVSFHDGGRYLHHDVPPHIHAGLMIADSKGGFFSRNIRGKYPASKIS